MEKGIWMFEIVFEYVRLSRFPNKPSRYQSLFAFESPDDIAKVPYLGAPVYLIEASNYSMHDMNWFEGSSDELSISRLMFLAKKYWSGARTDKPIMEVLVCPPAKVVELYATEAAQRDMV